MKTKELEAYLWGAKLAKSAGYDGVEIMGSEGYLINQFIAARIPTIATMVPRGAFSESEIFLFSSCEIRK